MLAIVTTRWICTGLLTMKSCLLLDPPSMGKGLFLDLSAIVHGVRADLVTVVLCLFGKPLAILLRLGCK